MSRRTRVFHLGLVLVAGLFVWQQPASSAAQFKPPVMELKGLLRDLGFDPHQENVIIEKAVTLGLVGQWARYGRESFNWLDSHVSCDLRRSIQFEPWLLGLSVDVDLEPRIETFKSVGLTDPFALIADDLKLLKPDVPNQNLLKMADLLTEEGVEDRLKVIGTYPRFLMRRELAAVNTLVSWLKSTLKIDKVGSIIEGVPRLFDYTLSELAPTVTALRDTWFLDPYYIKNHPALMQVPRYMLQSLEVILAQLKLDLYSNFTPDERRWLIEHASSCTILDNLKALGHLPAHAYSAAGATVSAGWLSKNIKEWAFEPRICAKLFGPDQP